MLDQLPDEPSSPHQRSLLSCSRCGTPCALGSGPAARCAVCGSEVPLPAPVLRERDERRQRNQQRRDEDPFWQRVRGVRVRWWRSAWFIAPLSFVAPFLSAALGYCYGYRQGLYGQAGFVWLAGIGVIHFVTSLLLESRKEERVRAHLLARPPLQDGGPMVCRACSAPLSLPERSGGEQQECSCDHCSADNLIDPAADGKENVPRPDLYDAEAAYRDVYGDEVTQWAARLYPLTIFVGFLTLALLTYYAVEAPRTPVP